MPNMAFINYEFGIKSPHSTIITTEEACLQEELEVENDGLAALEIFFSVIASDASDTEHTHSQ